MTTNLSFTVTELIVAFGLGVAAIILLVSLGRRYFDRMSERNLTEKYKDKQWSSPLEARNKYPDVNVFLFRNTLVSLSLALTLGLMVGLFNLTTYEKKVFIPEGAGLALDVDMEVEPPRTQEAPPPPPPPPPPVIEEVPADLLVDVEDVEFVDQSVDEKTVILDIPVAMDRPTERKVAPPPPPPPPPAPVTEEIFRVVEEMPRFPGCEDLPSVADRKVCADKKLLAFIYANIQYPNVARENNIEGTVVIRFVVDKDGKVGQAEIIREIGGGCGEEARRVVMKMADMPERWAPGKQRGRPVNVYFTLPVKFVLKVDP
ncbi:MAG TPA: TonB family protein [Saprospiraceae bacterium]|nr:TonB family protein [Saprospiraceae bacterium]HMP22734.1 TonB family protein [Saprospiraceae bacterium]